MNNSELNPIKILLSLVDPDYLDKNIIKKLVALPPDKKQNLIKLTLKVAEKNGLRYYFLQKLDQIEDISFFKEEINEEKKRADIFVKTMNFLKKIAKDYGLNFILVKLFDTIPHIPNDIDVFIHEEEKRRMIKLLEMNGMVCIHSGPAETKFKGNYMKTDIYTKIVYFGVEFVDRDFLMTSTTKNKFLGVDYIGPNQDADFLILLPHIIFGHRKMTLLDFLHLKNLMKKVNMDKCKEYAREKGWEKLFDAILNHVRQLHQNIYVKNKIINFPYIFNRKFVIDSLSLLENFNKKEFNPLFFNLSFYLEEVMYKFENTKLYDLIKSSESIRNLFNSVASFAKSKLGYRS